MKIKTTTFQEMMSRAVKGAGNNKLIPLTSLISIKSVNSVLTLITTDATNYLYIKQSGVEGDDIKVVVQAERIAKLVSKMTSEFIELENKGAYLEVVGNGTYQIDIPADENGMEIEYPDPMADTDITDMEAKEVTYNTIQKILNTVKPALAVTMEDPEYTGYYVGDTVLATNREIITDYDENLLGQDKLISVEMMNLLGVMSHEKFSAYIDNDTIIFDSPDCIVYGKEQEGIEDFAVDTIKGFLDIEMNSMCKVNRSDLLNVLDRLFLFVTSYDNETIKLIFTDNSLIVKSLKDTGYEELKYVESDNVAPFEAYINIEYLITQLKAQDGENATICYGASNAIRMEDGDILQFVALSQNPESV